MCVSVCGVCECSFGECVSVCVSGCGVSECSFGVSVYGLCGGAVDGLCDIFMYDSEIFTICQSSVCSASK